MLVTQCVYYVTYTDSEEVLVAKEKQRLGLLKSLSRSIKEV